MEPSRIIRIRPVFEDSRGSISDILEAMNIQHVGLIVSRKGAVRGNHYHRTATQYIYMLSGRADYFRKDLRKDGASIEAFVLEPGDLAVEPPNVAHTLIALEDCQFLDMTDVSREGSGFEDDTVRIDIATGPSSGIR